ncbi:MAG: DUF460 domain-containing protein [Candidatus Aenigmatarchaeota archaeon]
MVAVDPGITTGIAILDAYGNILDIYSKRDMSRAEIINHILKFGKPVVMSSDVKIVPSSVEKVATKLGCILYSPDASLSLNEKRELTKENYHILKNDHEVDALAAAIKAWKYYRTLFSKVNNILKKFNKQEIFADVMLKVIKEGGPNIEDTIREFIERKQETPMLNEKATQKDLIEKLQKKLVEKQNKINLLQKQNILISQALNEARKELKRLKETKIEKSKTEDYQEIKNNFEYLKKLRKIEIKGYYPVVELGELTENLVNEIDRKIDLEGRVIFTPKKNLYLLNEKNVKCVLTFDEIKESDTEQLEFPIIKIDENALETFDGIKAVKIDYIEKKLSEAKKLGLIRWLKSYRKRKE